MRFKKYQLLTEGRGEPMEQGEAYNWIDENCVQLVSWMKTGRHIARVVGGKSISQYWFVEPKSVGKPRRSANTLNYYTLLMDSNPRWKQFPKRSQSLICLTDGSYRGRDGWVVFPKDGWRIGDTGIRDLWGAGRKFKLDNMDDWNIVANEYLKFAQEQMLGKKLSSRNRKFDKHLSEFKAASKVFDEYINSEGSENVRSIGSYIGNKFGYAFNTEVFEDGYKGDFFKMVNDMITPENMGFTLARVGEQLSELAEVWTDSPCVLINGNQWDKEDKVRILGP